MALTALALCVPGGARSTGEGEAPGDWLVVGSPGARALQLYDCPDGRRLARAALPAALASAPAAMPVPDGESALPGASAAQRSMLAPAVPAREAARPRPSVGPETGAPALAYAITGEGMLRVWELPSLRLHAETALAAHAWPAPGAAVPQAQATGAPAVAPFPPLLVATPPQVGLLAVGGAGPVPLVMLDARTLAQVHVYRPDEPTVVAALVHVHERASFLAGLAEPRAPAEIWELAHAPDAPPVLRGLVHDYRMGEAVALPGRFTPRPVPVATPTAALLPGVMPYEWLRIDRDGRATVLHLEVRREIGRLPDDERGAGPWLAAAWQGDDQRGWLVGRRGSPALAVLDARAARSGARFELPGPLLAIEPFAGKRSALAAVGDERGARLLRVDRPGTFEAVSSPLAGRAPFRLARSRDGRCIALLDAADRWLGAQQAR